MTGVPRTEVPFAPACAGGVSAGIGGWAQDGAELNLRRLGPGPSRKLIAVLETGKDTVKAAPELAITRPHGQAPHQGAGAREVVFVETSVQPTSRGSLPPVVLAWPPCGLERHEPPREHEQRQVRVDRVGIVESLASPQTIEAYEGFFHRGDGTAFPVLMQAMGTA